MRNEWVRLLFACGFGPTLLKAGTIHLPAVDNVRCCNNCPLEKKKKRKGATNRKSIHPNQRKVNPSYYTTFPPLKSDTMERARVKLCDAGYNQEENLPSPTRYFFHWCWHHFDFHIRKYVKKLQLSIKTAAGVSKALPPFLWQNISC